MLNKLSSINILFSFTALTVDKFKHEDLENHSTINQVPFDSELLNDINFSREKLDSVLEAETRGIDFKGNVRYFCPKCNVRYIGKLKS